MKHVTGSSEPSAATPLSLSMETFCLSTEHVVLVNLSSSNIPTLASEPPQRELWNFRHAVDKFSAVELFPRMLGGNKPQRH